MQFKPNDYIKLTKLSSVDDPRFDTPSWDQYDYGDREDFSIPIDYWLTGRLVSSHPVEGSTCYIARDSRNGTRCGGALTTSRIQVVEEGDGQSIIFHTTNSIYKLEKLPDPLISGHSEWGGQGEQGGN